MITDTITTRPPTMINNLFAKVARAKQEWEATVDALPQLICMVNQDQQLLRANRTLERWQLGDVTHVAGKDFHTVLHPGCRDPACYLRHLLVVDDETGAPVQAARQLEVYDPVLARHLLIEVCPTPAPEPPANPEHARPLVEPAPPAWGIILHDVSERKRLLRSLQRQADRLKAINGISRSILAAVSPEMMATSALEHLQSFLPLDQAVIFLRGRDRRRLQVLAGINQSAVLRAGTWTAVERISYRALNQAYYVGDLAQQPLRSELESHFYRQGIVGYANVPLRSNGRWLGTLIVGTRSREGLTHNDLSVLEEVADLLTVALQQSQLHVQLEETNRELEQNLRAKQENLQELSHELRSPLSLIHGFVALLRDGSLGPLTEKQQEALSVVENRGEYLLSLVERHFLLQTLENRKADLLPVNIGAFLYETVIPWQLPAHNRGIKLELHLDPALPTVPADRELLSQVISNLLDNAVKFTPAGAAINVTATATREQVIIEVVDEGTGIAPEQVDTIFDRYVKAQGSSGAGIGLALCREVMRAHGGTITASSEGEGRGSTFTVTLPRPRRLPQTGPLPELP